MIASFWGLQYDVLYYSMVEINFTTKKYVLICNTLKKIDNILQNGQLLIKV